MHRIVGAVVGLAGMLVADATPGEEPPQRWYTREHVVRGAVVYTDHCAVCHGKNAEGTENWRQRNADDKFPPPPIDGTAHAWHHPIRVLGAQIKFGAPGGRGSMPGFADKLTDQQIVDVIAWFQDKWPDRIYAAWQDIESRAP